jgi:hypothetical protein
VVIGMNSRLKINQGTSELVDDLLLLYISIIKQSFLEEN